MKHWLLAACLLTTIACSNSPTAPSYVSVAGTWRGTSADNLIGGGGQLAITLTQSGSSLSGTWSSVWPNPANNNGGTFNGTATGAGVTGTLTPSNPSNCPTSATAMVSGSTMSGTYATISCSVADTGSFTLTKQ